MATRQENTVVVSPAKKASVKSESYSLRSPKKTPRSSRVPPRNKKVTREVHQRSQKVVRVLGTEFNEEQKVAKLERKVDKDEHENLKVENLSKVVIKRSKKKQVKISPPRPRRRTRASGGNVNFSFIISLTYFILLRVVY